MEIKDQFDPELRKSIAKKIAVIPVGSIEQHGPHLPLSTDTDIVTAVSKKLSEKLDALLLPTISYGVSYEHAPFVNLSVSKGTLRKFLQDLIDSLFANKVKTVFVINGHHGNQDALKGLDKKSKVFVFSYWRFMDTTFDHAGFAETSLMLAISKNVKMSKAKKGLVTDGMSKSQIKNLGKKASKSFPSVTKNGVWGDPTRANRRDGSKMLAQIIKNLEKKCQTCLTGQNPKLHQ